MAQYEMVRFKNLNSGLEFSMWDNQANYDTIRRMRNAKNEYEELEPMLKKAAPVEKPKEEPQANETAQEDETKPLDKMTRDELRELAKTLGLEGYGNLNKGDLVALIQNAE